MVDDKEKIDFSNLTEKQRIFCHEYLLNYSFKSAIKESNLSLISKPNKFYVYFLINPLTDRIFYIGKGLGSRYKSHLKNYKKDLETGNFLKASTIQTILSNNKKPIEFIFCKNLSEQNALGLEYTLINNIKFISNIHGGVMSDVQRNIESAKTILNRMVSEEEILLRPIFNVGNMTSLEMYYKSKDLLKSMVDGSYFETIGFSKSKVIGNKTITNERIGINEYVITERIDYVSP